MSLHPELEALAEAIQRVATLVAQEDDEPAGLVTQAIVVWEVVSQHDSGQVTRQVQYTVPTDNFSLAGSVGLLEHAKALILS